MNKEAIYHRPNREFCYFIDGMFLVKLRAKRNDIKEAYLYYAEKWLPKEGKLVRVKMELVCSSEMFDYFECLVPPLELGIQYFFELFGDVHLFYGQFQFFDEVTYDGNYMFECPVDSRIEEAYLVPKWAQGAVVYQIFPERFCNVGSKRENLSNWYKAPITRDDFLGGTLKGITSKLPYLHELGIDVLYMCPIFESISNHKYDTSDYFHVDKDFGTNEDLKELTTKAHELGMHVMLDGVFNHCGYRHPFFQDVVNKGKASPYYDWFYVNGDASWELGKLPNYKSFAFFGGMPKINLANNEARRYIFDCVKMWMKDYGVDGFRLDVPEEYSHDFSKKLRLEMMSVKKDTLISGEVWHEASDYLLGDEFDTVMNYCFRNAVLDLLVNKKITSNQFHDRMGFLRGMYKKDTVSILWNLLDSHDTPRFLFLAKENKDILKAAVGIMMTLSGMPFIYYGDEVGLTGDNDPDCRRGMLWEGQDLDLFNYYQKLIKIRHESDALKFGEYKPYIIDDNVLSYYKIHGDDVKLIAINLSSEDKEIASLKDMVNQIDEKSTIILKPYQVFVGNTH